MDEDLQKQIERHIGLDIPWAQEELKQIFSRINPETTRDPLEELRRVATEYLQETWLELQNKMVGQEIELECGPSLVVKQKSR